MPIQNALKPRDSKWYGWRKDTPDPRDALKLFSAARPELYREPLPASVTLKDKFPECYNQGETSSCVGNSSAGAIEFLMAKDGCPIVSPSRLLIYWDARVLSGDTAIDNGCQIRDAIKSLRALGYCRESVWPFAEDKVLDEPPAEAFTEASDHQITKAFALVNPRDYKVCLAAGYPFIFGMMVYPEFEGDDVEKTGVVAMPPPNECPIGGHAVLCVGYDENERTYLVRNSWGSDWGQEGYFTLPYDYVHDPHLCSDFWTLRAAESDVFPQPCPTTLFR